MGRAADGALDIIRTPNDGVPVILLAGQTFDAVLTARTALRLLGGDTGVVSPALNVEWSDLPGGLVKARCTVAADAPAGTYALEAVANDRTDRNVRAVYIRQAYLEYYILANLTDTHIGSDRSAKPAGDAFINAIKAVNESPAVFAVITGDLTDSGDLAQFQRFLSILDTCLIPTFVCPGNHDRQDLNYEQVFGPMPYMFRFGDDGYIAFDTKDYVTADDLGPQPGGLEIFRRDIKACRWSIGFTHRYESSMGMRSQITLFIDNPLDFLIFGHWHRVNKDTERVVPWGTTPVTVTPATADGFFRLIDVSAKGVKAREPQHAGGNEK